MTTTDDSNPPALDMGARRKRADIFARIDMERDAQVARFGNDFAGRDPNEWLSIAMEEASEVVLASNPEDKAGELVQWAAVITGWLEHLDTEGASNQFPEGATFALDVMNLGDRCRAFNDSRNNEL